MSVIIIKSLLYITVFLKHGPQSYIDKFRLIVTELSVVFVLSLEMVRKYNKKRLVTFDSNTMDDAVKAVRDGTLTLFAASKQFKVARSTLRRHLDEKLQKVGVKPVFSVLQEKHIVERVVHLAKRGFPMTIENICEMVFRYGKKLFRQKKLQRPIPENWNVNQQATYDWFSCFRTRHAELSLRIPEGLSSSRAQAFNATRIDSFFNQYCDLIKNLELEDYPNLIYNADETGLASVPTSSQKVVALVSKQIAFLYQLIN
jgi:hypothetical protein